MMEEEMNNEKLHDIINYMYVHGIVMGTKKPVNVNGMNSRFETVSHLPFALKPYNFPKKLFENGIDLCTLYNNLMHNIASDSKWLIEILNNTAESDPFTKSLLEILIKTNKSNDNISKQNIVLGILRSDYMIHQQHDASNSQAKDMKLLQVEINTIASSFFTLSSKIAHLYKYFNKLNKHEVSRDGIHQGICESVSENQSVTDAAHVNVPDNDAFSNVVMGLASAHYEYLKLVGGVDGGDDSLMDLNIPDEADADVLSLLASPIRKHKLKSYSAASTQAVLPELLPNPLLSKNKPIVIVMVVQPNEHNFGDQTPVEVELLNKYNIVLKRLTLVDLYAHTKLIVKEATFQGQSFCYKELLYTNGSIEHIVSVVYYRAGYTPTDYPTNCEWEARLRIEESFAIKCPNISYHLAGCKKIQQVIAQDKTLLTSRFGCSEIESKALHDSFAGLWSLETASESDKNVCLNEDESIEHLTKLVQEYPSDYVLKPQREGGGNNVYNEEIYNTIKKSTPAELNSYILMERIKPPTQRVQLVRGNVINDQVCM